MTKSEDLERKVQNPTSAEVPPERTTWGMRQEGFQSIGGIPDEFYSAEDSSDRVALWNSYQRSKSRTSECGCGDCSLCDPTYKD